MIKCNNVESALFSPLSYYYHGQNVDIIKEMAYSCLSGALRKHIVSLEFSDHFPDFLLHFCKIFFCSGLEATNCILGNRFHLRLNFKVQHIIIECIFLSERQHYVTFHWSLMFTFLFTFLFPNWKGLGDLKF